MLFRIGTMLSILAFFTFMILYCLALLVLVVITTILCWAIPRKKFDQINDWMEANRPRLSRFEPVQAVRDIDKCRHCENAKSF